MFGFIGNFGPWELAMIMFIVLLIFGPGKLPKVGSSLGSAIKNFRKASTDEKNELGDS